MFFFYFFTEYPKETNQTRSHLVLCNYLNPYYKQYEDKTTVLI